MIQIAFCDDDQTVLDQLSALLEKYRAQRCVQIQCTAFHSPLDLLAEIEKGTRYDILFLDVIMPAENGITAAKEIRQYDNVVKIIFLTSSAEFAVESYVVGAYFYQLKPIWEDSFFPLMDSVMAACRRAEPRSLVLRCKSGISRIELEKLLPAAEAKKSAAQTRLTELLTYAEKTRTAIDGINAEIATLAKAQAGVDELKEQYAEADAALTVDNIRIGELDQQAGHSRRQMEEIEAAEAKLEVLRRQATEQGQFAADYEELKRAFSQDGIPHNIVRSIVPLFEATATSIISQMSGGRMSIEMRMEKTLKSNSKKEVTALDIIVNDAATGALPYMSRSGGERVKAALSVILAMAELKSSTAGVQLGFLFIDEPPFLDDKGVQAYCDALEAIQKRYSSLKIMAITHDPEMKARFPQSVDVVKTAEGSKVIYS